MKKSIIKIDNFYGNILVVEYELLDFTTLPF